MLCRGSSMCTGGKSKRSSKASPKPIAANLYPKRTWKRHLPGGRVKIKWTDNAHVLLDGVHAFYAEIDRRLAAKMFRAIKQSVRRLTRFPASGRIGKVP